MLRLVYFMAAVAALVFTIAGAAAQSQAPAPAEIKIGYLRSPEPRLTLSLLDLPAENDGVAGAELAIADNNTTGQFTQQTFTLETAAVASPEEVQAALDAFATDGAGLVAANLPAPLLLAAADMARERNMLVFNIG